MKNNNFYSNNDNIKNFTLDNGLEVILMDTNTQTINGKLRINSGALNESKNEFGYAHFLEHLIITGGSSKYSPNKSKEMRVKLDYINALTNLNSTQVVFDIWKDDIHKTIDYIADSVFTPKFDESKFYEEKLRVLREIADYGFENTDEILKKYFETILGKNSQFNYKILGDKKSIQNASLNDLINFYNKGGYNPNNMDLILVGNLPKNIEDIIYENFSHFKKGEKKKIEIKRNPKINGANIFYNHKPELMNRKNPEMSSTNLNMAIYAPDYKSDEYASMLILNKILGNNLFKNISVKNGLAYSFGSDYNTKDNQGILYIGGNINSKKINPAINSIFEETSKLQEKLVSYEKVEKVKRKELYNIAKLLETNEGKLHSLDMKFN